MQSCTINCPATTRQSLQSQTFRGNSRIRSNVPAPIPIPKHEMRRLLRVIWSGMLCMCNERQLRNALFVFSKGVTSFNGILEIEIVAPQSNCGSDGGYGLPGWIALMGNL